MIFMASTLTLASLSPLPAPAKIVLWLVTRSYSDPRLIRMGTIDMVRLVELGMVDVPKAPYIRRIIVRKGSGIHSPTILIYLPRNKLARFASTSTSARNGATTPPMARVLVSSDRSLAIPRKVIIILKIIFPMLAMGKIMAETRGISLIATSLSEWTTLCLIVFGG